MIRVSAMTALDARMLRPLEQPQTEVPDADGRVLEFMEMARTEDMWSFFWNDQLLAIGGCGFPWRERMVVWIVLDEAARKHLLPLTRFLRAFIDEYHVPRVEMHVCEGFKGGAQLARLLGFQNETPEPLRRFFPNGRNAHVYARCV